MRYKISIYGYEGISIPIEANNQEEAVKFFVSDRVIINKE